MIINKKYITITFISLLVGFFVSYFIFKKEIDNISVNINIPVKIPSVEKEFDTIKLPSEVKILPGEKVIDSTYYNEYIKLKDSIKKNKAYKDAITLREYNNIFEDENITINTYNKVRGTLLETQSSYKTKERTIIIDTTLNIPVPRKAELYIGGDFILPTDPVVLTEPSIAPGFILVNKKHNKTYKGGYDINNKAVKVGIYFRL